MQQPDNTLLPYPPAGSIHRLQPVVYRQADYVICGHCYYINELAFHFCTQCGIPLHPEEPQPQTLYNVRAKQRQELLDQLEGPIQTARITLYLLTAFCCLGIVFLLNQPGDQYLLVAVLVLLGLLFGGMAHWSSSKPFTALLIGFITLGMFFLLSFLGKLSSVFSSVQGVYSIFISIVVLYILFKGIRAAYKAAIIHAETENP